MNISRRSFVTGAAAAGVAGAPWRVGATPRREVIAPDRFDPWIEVDAAALRHNVRQVARLTGNRPILAVVKNNAYGLGLAGATGVLEALPEIAGFAVVKAEAAIALRDAGVRKPVLLMAMFSDADGIDLAARNIHFSLYSDDAGQRVGRVAARLGRAVPAHWYLDTGMGRMGMPAHRAVSWMATVAGGAGVRIEGAFMAFTEEPDFDPEQLRRFNAVAAEARHRSIPLGRLHAASSNGVFHLPDAHLDMVRPGIALFGGYPSDPPAERPLAELRPAIRLRARVVRVVRLRPGDTVSYGRHYVAQKPTWVATLPVGHTDGYPRRAVNGGRVLIGNRLYPVIGAVSASHCIVEVGDEPTVAIGDLATCFGPDDPAITPTAFAETTGVSVYDVFMHLNPDLPRIVV